MRVDPTAHSSRSAAATPRNTNGTTMSTLGKAPISGALNTNGTNGTAYSNGTSFTSSTFFGHDREEVARILIQGLSDLGYQTSANALAKESGFELETSHAAAFRLAVVEGDWEGAEGLVLGNGTDDVTELQSLALAPGASREEMLFLIRQQKYLELLEKRDLSQALFVLRHELAPIRPEDRQLHILSSLIMCQSSEDLKYQAKWDGASGQSRKELFSTLSKSISPSAMIPEHRLADLLSQVKESQITHCLYHNTHEWPSLYMDHQCDRNTFPLHDSATLDDHTDEVWSLEFSHNGRYLATASADCTCRIYDTSDFRQVHVLSAHTDPTTYIAWSPDDSKILTCSQDCHFRLWDTSTGRSLRSVHQGEYPVTTAAWAPDGRHFVTGSQDTLCPLAIWDAESSDLMPVHNFDRVITRVMDCAVGASLPRSAAAAQNEDSSATPIRLVAICSQHKVHVFDWLRREKLIEIPINHNLTSISLAPDGSEMLVNLGSTQEIWALDVETGQQLQKYRGQVQGEFVIRSAYGGATGGFVVCGGEDSQVTAWHRHSGRLLHRFKAHANGCVNAVAWNMAKPEMFASVGDDRKVRVWSVTNNTPNTSIRGSLEQAREEGGTVLPSWGSTGWTR